MGVGARQRSKPMNENDIQVIEIKSKPNPSAKFYYDCPHDSRVMTVAVVDETTREWFAYVAAVPGHLHTVEWKEVARHGSPLDHGTAKLWWPNLAEFTWSDLITFNI